MLDDADKLPDDPSVLKGLVSLLASEVKSQAVLIEKLKHQLAGMRQHRFGSRSEWFSSAPLQRFWLHR